MSSNIIKARTNSVPSGPPVVTRESYEASRGAKEILARAEERAAQILEAAEHEKQQLLARSMEQGHAAGLQGWNEALAEAWKKRDEYLAKNESELVKLAIAVAQKVIGDHVADHRVALHAVREAIKSVRGGRRLTIKVHPGDEAAVRAQVAELRAISVDLTELSVVGQSSVNPGGCIVESEFGTIDARISTQLLSLEKALLGRQDDGKH